MNDEELYDDDEIEEILYIDDDDDIETLDEVYDEEIEALDEDGSYSTYDTSSSFASSQSYNFNNQSQPDDIIRNNKNQNNDLSKTNSENKQSTKSQENRDFDKHKMNASSNNSKDSEKIKQALNKNKNQNQARNNNEDGEKNGLKEKKEQIQNEALQQGASAAIQSAGIPKPLADAVASQITIDKVKKQLIKNIVIMCLPTLFIILVPMLIFAGDNNSSYVSSGMASEYLYGSGSESTLYDYLESINHCSGEEECKNSEGAKFYKKLKEKLQDPYLTNGEADAVIIAFIGYNRGSDDMFKAIDEIDFIANILTKNGAFSIDNIDSYRDDFIKIDDANSSYFSKHRSDLVSDATIEDRQAIFRKMVQNARSISSMNDYSSPITGGTCTYNVDGMNPSDIKVRLLECDDATTSIASEELIDFEKYITGVVYAENAGGPYEALKAQAIAARSYALTRGTIMGESSGLGLSVENGEWILSIRNCTADQVYCDPDKGCWSDSSTAGATVHSVFAEGKAFSKGVLAQDSNIRKAVEETKGEVVVDSAGKILYTPFKSETQNQWNTYATEGKDHFQILKTTYSNMSNITKSCRETGDYANWKQCNMPWSGIQMGKSSSNICDIGCLVTSLAIQIERSGTELTVSEFDPGVLVKSLNANGAFSSGGSLNTYNMPIAPNFKYVGSVSLSGTRLNKATTIKKYADQGYYIVIKAKSNQHWVALNYVDGENIYIFDPNRNITNIWDSAEYDVPLIVYFKA